VPLFQTDVYILKGGEEEIFIPPFTYHGFRYAFIEGLEDCQATSELLSYILLSSDIEKHASFTCSDEDICKLYNMTVNADLSNFHYFLTDCPHREKNGWTGDASASAEQVLMIFDADDSLKLWLRAMKHAQREDGMLPGVVPTEKYGYAWGNGPMWDSAAINIPYASYKYSGRLDLFLEVAEMLDRYLHYISSRRDENGLIACGLGDWCQPGKAQNIPIKAPLELTDSVTTYDTATKAAFLYNKVGMDKQAEYASSLAAELRRDIRQRLIDYDTMTASGSCQTSQAYMIAKGIFEPEEYPAAYKKLLEIIARDGEKLDTGMIGLRYIFEVLILGGDIELALRLILNDEGPSYKIMINRGCTALCEAIEDGTVNASENHHFFGDIIRVFTNYIAGLRPNPELDSPNEILFSPVITDTMDYAEAEYKGARTGWKRSGDKIIAYADIPAGFFGNFVYGERKEALAQGYNEFII
jgi:alpha-L-rhamnosidase